ncbi:hypothetical protein MKW98_004178, partial [Papaver atlanticum]
RKKTLNSFKTRPQFLLLLCETDAGKPKITHLGNLKIGRNLCGMNGMESLWSYVKRDTDDSPDSDRAGDEEDWESSCKRKHCRASPESTLMKKMLKDGIMLEKELCSRPPGGKSDTHKQQADCAYGGHDALGSREGSEPADPFSLVADELSLIAIGNRLHEMVVAEVLLLMASAQHCIAEITEMIHVASLLQDDVLDDTDTRRDVRSPNFTMGKKLCSSRSFSAFSSLCGTCLS